MTINITTENSVFLIIDIQEKLVKMLKENISETCKKNSKILIQIAKKLNIETVVTEQYPKGLGSTIEDLSDFFTNNTKIFEKTDFNALTTNGIKDIIKEKENIFIFGIETHICVFQTAINLLNENYNVFVIKDACASREKEEYKTSLNLMEKEGAKLITTEMVLFEMLKSSKHPLFKDLQGLIK